MTRSVLGILLLGLLVALWQKSCQAQQAGRWLGLADISHGRPLPPATPGQRSLPVHNRLEAPQQLPFSFTADLVLPLCKEGDGETEKINPESEGMVRDLLTKGTASLPLMKANMRDAERAKRREVDGGGSGKGQGTATSLGGGASATAGHAASTEGGSIQNSWFSNSLGTKIVGGLRGHLMETQRAKGLEPVGMDRSTDLGRKDALSGIQLRRVIEDEEEAVLDGNLADEDEDNPFTNWWQAGSHWQPMVRPFVVKRPVLKPGSLAQSKSGLSGLTSYIPGMREKTGIPKVFHQVYLAGEEAFHEAEQAAAEMAFPTVKAEWREACKRLHPAWEFRLWNLTAMEDLLARQYPWFLETFLAYPQLIHKVDAVRPFIMHAFGGVYIDVDVECIQPVDGFLEDHELVFQEEDFGQKSLVNSAIAGVPGHHFWTVWQQTMMERAPQLQMKRGVFSRSDYEVIAVLNATGPWALRAAFKAFCKDYGLLHEGYVGAWKINETNVMVYPLGTWFVPCLWDNLACHKKVESLIQQQSIPLWLAGHHKNAGSWFQAAHFSRKRRSWRDPLKWLAICVVAGFCFWLVLSLAKRRPRSAAARRLRETKRRD